PPDLAGTPDPPPGVTVNARLLPAAVPGFAEVYELARAAGQGEGVVIVRDTDTIIETAWALDLLRTGDAPVVLIPAPGHPGDLAGAVGAAAPPPAGPARRVVAGGQTHPARHAARTAGSAPAFASPAAGPLGHVTDGTVRLLWHTPGRFTVRGPHG